MASRLYEIAFQIGGKLQASLPKSIMSAAGQLDRLGKQISQLEKAQGTSNRFRSLHREIDDTKLKLRQAEGEFKHLGSTVGPMTAEMARRFDAASAKVAKLREQFRAQATEMKSVRAAMGAAGIHAQSFSADNAKLAAALAKAQSLQQRIREGQGARNAAEQRLGDAKAKFGAAAGRFAVAAGAEAAWLIPLKVTADFEDSMVRAGALAKATDGQLEQLTATARQLGRDTRFSAVQVATGMQYLAQSGFKVNEIVAAMPGMLDIAAAGGVDLGEAADITANILRGFGMQAGEAARLGDVLTNTFTTSSTNLSKLGETMKYVGPVARAMGLSLESTAAAAGLLGNAGIKGEQAGTGLRAVLLRLAAPMAAGRKELARLGIKTMDAHKNMRPLADILTDLYKSTEKFGTGSRQASIKAIFGMEAATAATVLLGEAGSGNLQRYTQAVAKSGTAAEVAAKQNATLKGAWDNLYGSMEDAAIQIGATLTPTLKELVAKLVPIVNSVTQWAQENPKLTTTIVLGAAALTTLVLGLTAAGLALSGIQVVIVAAQLAFARLNLVMLANPALVVASALLLLVAAGYLVGKNWDEIAEGGKIAWNAVRNAVVDTVDYIKKIDLIEVGKNLMKSLAVGILNALHIPTFAVEWLAKKLGLIASDASKDAVKDVDPNAWMKRVAFTDRPELGKHTVAAAALMSSVNAAGNVSSVNANMSVVPEGYRAPLGPADGSMSRLDGGISRIAPPSRGNTISYSPQITVSPGAAKDARAEVEKGLQAAQKEFEKMMRGFMEQDARLATD